MKPIFLFVVVSTSATGALLVTMGSHVGLIVCVVAVGLYEWFRWSDTTQKIAVPRSDERHDVEDSVRPAAPAVIRHTTGGAARQVVAPPAPAGRQRELTAVEAVGLSLDA